MKIDSLKCFEGVMTLDFQIWKTSRGSGNRVGLKISINTSLTFMSLQITRTPLFRNVASL
jgi:hypothetical protein